MSPEVIKKMVFSKDHIDLLLKLYNKEITLSEYDRLVESLYRPSKEACEGYMNGRQSNRLSFLYLRMFW
ncbi:adhesin [Bacillus tropicus]|nr:adhesin [Bacillus tropicus]